MVELLTFILFIVITGSVYAQGVSLPPTKAVRILGKINNPFTISDIDLKKFPVHAIGDIDILNSKGEVQKSWKALSGVKLKDLLDTVSLDSHEPSQTEKYSFVCQSIDGSKAVFSWNEIFRSDVGENVYIICMRDDQPMEELNESILLIATKESKTPFRFLRNLESIRVERAE